TNPFPSPGGAPSGECRHLVRSPLSFPLPCPYGPLRLLTPFTPRLILCLIALAGYAHVVEGHAGYRIEAGHAEDQFEQAWTPADLRLLEARYVQTRHRGAQHGGYQENDEELAVRF